MQIFHLKTKEARHILDRHALTNYMLSEAFERFAMLERLQSAIVGLSRCGVYYMRVGSSPSGDSRPSSHALGFIPWMLIHELLDDLMNATADAFDEDDDCRRFLDRN